MNVYYDIELVFNWVKENFILKHSVSLVNSPWYDYDIEIDLRLVKQALLNGNFDMLFVIMAQCCFCFRIFTPPDLLTGMVVNALSIIIAK